VDYGIVISSTITCIFDDGKRVRMGVGDVVVQRGTIHGWLNETNDWVRMYFILLGKLFHHSYPSCIQS
jgi:hypothetical protein